MRLLLLAVIAVLAGALPNGYRRKQLHDTSLERASRMPSSDESDDLVSSWRDAVTSATKRYTEAKKRFDEAKEELQDAKKRFDEAKEELQEAKDELQDPKKLQEAKDAIKKKTKCCETLADYYSRDKSVATVPWEASLGTFPLGLSDYKYSRWKCAEWCKDEDPCCDIVCPFKGNVFVSDWDWDSVNDVNIYKENCL